MALLCDLRRRRQHPAEAGCVGDEMVSGEHRHNCFGVLPAQMDGAQPDAGGGAPALRLDDKVLRRQFRRLRCQRLHVLGARDDENLFRPEKRRQPDHRVLEHRALPDQSKRLLGAITTAERPQSCPYPPGHNQCVERHHSFSP